MRAFRTWRGWAAVRPTDAIYVLVFTLLLAPSNAYSEGPGTSAAEFLTMNGGARQLGLGGAGLSDVDLGSGLANPAILGKTRVFGAAVSHDELYQGLRLESASIAVPVNDRFSVGVMAGYLHYGEIEGYDRSGVATGDVSAYSAIGGLGLGASLSDNVAAGISVKYFGEETGGQRRSGWAVDVGAHYDAGRVEFGAAVTNAGPEVTGDAGTSFSLPLTVRFGSAIDVMEGRLKAFSDIDFGDSDHSAVHQGFEIITGRYLTLRAGVSQGLGQNVEIDGAKVSFGAGLTLGQGRLDYGFQPGDWLGDVHRITMVWGLGL